MNRVWIFRELLLSQVKEQYGSAKKTLGPGTPHKDVMRDLSDKWKGLSLDGDKSETG
jgi:hypothetical protein